VSRPLELEVVTRAMLAARPGRGRRAKPKRGADRWQRHWTQAEDAILMREWGEVRPKTLLQKLPGRTWGAVRSRAVGKLGLPLGAPQGFLCIAAAAKRLGFGGEPQVLALAARHGITVRVYPFPLVHKPKSKGRQCVNWEDISEALAREVAETESVGPAARARDLNSATLWRWLRDAGELPEQRPGTTQRGPMRIPTAVIDRVVMERRAPDGNVSVLAVAQRLGIDHSVMSRWFHRIGVRVGGGRGRGVTPAQVAAVTAAVEASRAARAGRKGAPMASTMSNEGVQ
jgi:transposase-like protein